MLNNRQGFKERMFESSGKLVHKDSLVTFLYLLMRDHLKPGEVAGIIEEITSDPSVECSFTNGWLAQSAIFMAEEIRSAERYIEENKTRQANELKADQELGVSSFSGKKEQVLEIIKSLVSSGKFNEEEANKMTAEFEEFNHQKVEEDGRLSEEKNKSVEGEGV